MSTDHTALVSKVWNYAHVLRDQGIGYGDYVEQITFLLFLKMDQERSELLGEPSAIPVAWRWGRLAQESGDELEIQYRHTLESLAREGGLIGTIFRGAQNKLTDPAKLKRVVSLIDAETWIGIGVDVKGAIYEGLLERNAAEVKSGAGQYFTPRPLIQAMVTVLAPKVGETVHDPACGTGGFLLAAYEYFKSVGAAPLDRAQQRRLREATFSGVDIVDEVVRLAAMNLYLHGIGEAAGAGGSPIRAGDALAVEPSERFDLILTNPPFGKKSSYRVVGEDGEMDSEREDYERGDFKFTTGNKQLNFMQHIMTVMAATAAPPWCCPTTCCSRPAAPARASAAACWRRSTSIPCCGCRPASSTSPASRPMCCSSTSARRAPMASRIRRRSGSTTCAPTATSR
jgi:type I restriction enzyme M protein